MSKIPDVGELLNRLLHLGAMCSNERIYAAIVKYMHETGVGEIDVHLLEINCYLMSQSAAKRGDNKTAEACVILAEQLMHIENKFGRFL